MAYQANAIEDWWKHHYKESYTGQALSSKPDTMSDADYQIGQQLYNQYKQGMKYQSDYDDAETDSAERTAAAKVSADVSRQRLEKYLPQQLALQGLYGTGMSEDAYLKLQSQYQKAVSDADATHNQNLKDYKSTLDDQMHLLWTQTQGAINDIVADEKKEQTTKLLENYTTASTYLGTGTFNNAQEVLDYVGSMKGKVSDENYQLLLNEAQAVIKESGLDVSSVNTANIEGADAIINNIQASKINMAEASSFKSLDSGDTVTLTLNGQKLTVKSNGPAVSSEPAKHAEKSGVKDGHFFIYGDNDTVYIYSGGAAYKIASKSNSNENRAMYNDLRHYLQYGEYGDNFSEYIEKQKQSQVEASQHAFLGEAPNPNNDSWLDIIAKAIRNSIWNG